MIDYGFINISKEEYGIEVSVFENSVVVRHDFSKKEVEGPKGVFQTYYYAHVRAYKPYEWFGVQIDGLTPYKATKTAYIGDTEVTFYDTPQGNLTVYFPHEYTVERMADRIIVSFKELEEVTDVTISIL